MLVGYERVSTAEQKLELQSDALKSAGCEKIFSDRSSGGKFDRPQLITALGFVRPGDVLVVWRLDRLGRSLKHLIEVVDELKQQQVGFKSLSEGLDTTTPGGKLVFHIFGAIAEFERDLIRERTCAGLAAARARGRLGGRPKCLTIEQIRQGVSMFLGGSYVADICSTLDVSPATFYRRIYPEVRKTQSAS